MILNVCAIYDDDSREYQTPMAFDNLVNAERTFKNMTEREGSTLNKYLSSFSMILIGEYDTETAKMKNCEKHVIISGRKMIERKEKENEQGQK